MAKGFKNLAALAAQAADGKKGEDILVFNVRRVSGITDYVILASIGSPAQLEAVEEAISDVMETAGVSLFHRDGSDSALWRVLDFGGVMVHLMHPKAREFYALEKLYHGAPKTPWQANGKAPRRKS